MLIGYARVSTEDQHLTLQLDALQQAGCEKTFTDQLSGANPARPGLGEVLAFIRPGDVLVVWKLDRLGRSVRSLIDLVGDLEKQGVQFRGLTDSIDASTPAGRFFFFHVMANLAQMERELLLERTRAGLAAARRQGRVGGRQRKMTDGKIESARRLLAGGRPPKDVAADLGVSIPTLYRWLPVAAREAEAPQPGSQARIGPQSPPHVKGRAPV